MLRLTDQVICDAPSGVTTILSIEGFSQIIFCLHSVRLKWKQKKQKSGNLVRYSRVMVEARAEQLASHIVSVIDI